MAYIAYASLWSVLTRHKPARWARCKNIIPSLTSFDTFDKLRVRRRCRLTGRTKEKGSALGLLYHRRPRL